MKKIVFIIAILVLLQVVFATAAFASGPQGGSGGYHDSGYGNQNHGYGYQPYYGYNYRYHPQSRYYYTGYQYYPHYQNYSRYNYNNCCCRSYYNQYQNYSNYYSQPYYGGYQY